MPSPARRARRLLPVLLAACCAAQTGESQTAGGLFSEAEKLRAKGQAADLRQSIEKYGAALPLYRAAADRQGEAETLFGMARAHDSLSQKRQAAGFYTQALPLFRSAANRSGEAQTLIYLALDYDYLGESAKARSALSEALVAAEASQDPRAEAAVYMHGGYVADHLGEKQKALEYFERAIGLQRTLGNRRAEATALSGRGVLYYSMGDARKALEDLRPALELYRASNDIRDEAFTLTSIGAVHFSTDDYAQALDDFQQALPGWQRAGDRSGESSDLHNIATTYERLGRLEEAIEYFNKALAIHRAVGYKAGEANTLGNVGRLRESLGDYTAALDFYGRALPLHRAAANPKLEASTLHSMGVAHAALGERHKALEYFEQALKLRRAASDRNGEADTLDRMALLDASLGNRDSALDLARQALALHRASESRRGEAISLHAMAISHAGAGRLDAAIEVDRESLALFRQIGDRPAEAAVLYGIARSESGRNRLDEARARVEEAIDIVEATRTRVTNQELRTSFFASVQDYFELDIDLLMRLDRDRPGAGFAAAAFEVNERSRARSLLDLLAESPIDVREGVDPTLLERERALRRSLNAAADRQMALSRTKATAAQIGKAAADIAALTEERRSLDAEIRARSPHYAALTQPRPLTLERLQRELLDGETALVQYALGAERSYAWVVTRESVAGFALAPRAEIEASARRFVELASAADAKSEDAARALSRLALGPLASRLRSKRLAIVADGALEYVPFAALPRPGAGSRRLVADSEIVGLPSASTAAVLRTETVGRPRAEREVAVLADPVFRPDDARVTTQPAAAEPASPARALDLHLARLSGSRREAQFILASVPPARRLQALDFDASLPTATAPDLARYRIVHFATHAFVDTEHPELSSIVLSLVDARGRPREGILRLHEIYNLRWRADLVVLSACQTALGKPIRGEGMVGLTRGFMYAGVPRVVASLWKVDDQATAQFMKFFYDALLRPGGMRPSAALRAAQLKMLAEPRWSAPCYWAAFVLRGEWL